MKYRYIVTAYQTHEHSVIGDFDQRALFTTREAARNALEYLYGLGYGRVEMSSVTLVEVRENVCPSFLDGSAASVTRHPGNC